MLILEGKNIGEVWVKYLNAIITGGTEYFDEDERIIELENIVLVIDKDDMEDDTILREYADMHLKSLYLKKMQTLEVVPELNASYGKRIYDQLGVNQYAWCVDRLKRKPETKAATMSLLLPDDPGPRIPCLDIIDLKLRYNRLNIKTFFRSQNAMNAYGNLSALFWLQSEFCRDLSVDPGKCYCYISNGHIYVEKLEEAKHIVRRCLARVGE